MPRRSRVAIVAVLAAGCAAACALAWPSPASGVGSCASPEIRVWKREGVLELRCDGVLRRSMLATFGASPVGQKEREGDERTPEGTYRVSSAVKNERFHRFLGVSYPNDEDRRRAKEKGITRPGGGIGIHGTRKDLAGLSRLWIRLGNATGLAALWGPTDGCIGVTNEDAELLFEAAPVGTKVVIAASRR